MEIHIKADSVLELRRTYEKIRTMFPEVNVKWIPTHWIIEEAKNAPLTQQVTSDWIKITWYPKIYWIEMTYPIIIDQWNL